jgi:hypothetical protein
MAFSRFSRQLLLSKFEWKKYKCKKAKYSVEYKEEAVLQIIYRCHAVIDVAKRLIAINDMKSMWSLQVADGA